MQRTIRLFVFWGLFLVGCSPPPVDISTNLAVSSTGTAVVTLTASSPTPEPLLATQTAGPTPITLPTKTPVFAGLDAPIATPEPTATFAAYGLSQIIGGSAGGRSIESYRFGFGSQTIVLVGGMHGGYEWNTIVLAYEMIDYFLQNPDQVPANISLYIIPSANPDGQFTVTGIDGRFTAADVTGSIEPGRFNAHQVDLNRNWACEWQAEAVWGNTVVSGGSVPFSEPETAALRTFFLRENPEMVLFWHSKADGIYIGSCGDLYQPSKDIAEIYGRAAGYTVYDQFTAYAISGDASDWLATQGIPSFTVELKTRSQTDWSQNIAGVLALLDYYGR
jgi:predicted deacylase